MIADVSVQKFNGKAVRPKPAVTLNDVKLKEGRDFNYVYGQNLAPGCGNITIEAVEGNENFVLNGQSPSVSFLIK